MIVYYSIENFKSINNEQKISFLSRKVKSKIKPFKNGILPVVSIYGPNGGGKSSILESISYIAEFIKAKNDVIFLGQSISILSFLKNKWGEKNKDSKWKFGFLSEEDLYYEYEIWLNDKGISFEKLSKKESLNNKNELEVIFERNNEKVIVSEKIKKIKIILNNIPGTLLSYLSSTLNDKDLFNVYNEFNKIIIFKSNLFSPIVFDPLSRPFYTFNIDVLNEQKSKILKILSDLDINIKGISILNQLNGKIIIIKKNGPNGEFEIPFELESDGTKKIIQLLVYIVQNIDKGSFFCVDEIDSQLHTKLLGYIIEMFNSEFNKKSQIIFTSHDIHTLSNEYFRKDEIYFAALNELCYTDVICLAEFGNAVREKTSISSKYLKGEFGYDPYIKKCEGWE